ncbi:MAG: gephyrin-like molybdotransferase Glp [Polyangia bacterium]
MHSIEEARRAALSLVAPPRGEDVVLDDARGRVLVEALFAAADVPAAPTSMMDGYAVNAGGPALRRIVEESAAGAPSERVLALDEAAPISTGALLPTGADSIVPVEDSVIEGASVRLPATQPGRFVRTTGSDLVRGEQLLSVGVVLDATAIALVAGQGLPGVRVAERPHIAIFSLGEELRRPGEPLPPGALYDSNGPALAAACEDAGARAERRPLVPDDLRALTTALRNARADIILTSGGASVGVHDHLRAAIEAAGGEVLLWRVAMKPGKPLVLGRIGTTPVVGLPGNPVSALVSFHLFVRPMILTMLGRTDVDLPRVRLPLSSALPKIGDRRELVRARIVRDARGVESLVPEPRQASSALLGLARADALIDCQPGLIANIGDTLLALRLR